jgi:hypothetical protein
LEAPARPPAQRANKDTNTAMLSENAFEIEISVCDLAAFFLVAPDIIGRDKFDSSIDAAETLLIKYLDWLIPRGLVTVVTAFITISMILFFCFQSFNRLDYISNIARWFGYILAIAVSVPPMLLGLVAFFRTHVPRGAPSRAWLLAGSFVFLLARLMTIFHAIGVIQTGDTSETSANTHLLWYFPIINMTSGADTPHIKLTEPTYN